MSKEPRVGYLSKGFSFSHSFSDLRRIQRSFLPSVGLRIGRTSELREPWFVLESKAMSLFELIFGSRKNDVYKWFVKNSRLFTLKHGEPKGFQQRDVYRVQTEAEVERLDFQPSEFSADSETVWPRQQGTWHLRYSDTIKPSQAKAQ